MSLRLKIAALVAGLVLLIAGLWLWRAHGLVVWLESGLGFCA
jgi:hypothetical protein